jgi:pimeloyl-ACP methyl ester carboxylesterase
MVAAVLLSKTTRETNPAAVEGVRSSLRGFDRRMLRNAVQSISLHRPDLTPLLSQVDVPTLIVTGSDHPGFTPEQARQAASSIKHAGAAVIDDCAYLLPLEAPTQTVALVRNFWSASTRAAA